MSITMANIRTLLEGEHPNYEAARLLGPVALPLLGILIRSAKPMLASKAVALAAMIGGTEALPLLQVAAGRKEPTIRIAAAAAVRHLPPADAQPLLDALLRDEDPGVRKIALKSIQARPEKPELLKYIETLMSKETFPHLRELARKVFESAPPAATESVDTAPPVLGQGISIGGAATVSSEGEGIGTPTPAPSKRRRSSASRGASKPNAKPRIRKKKSP